jgi:hypothetical protein
VFAGGFPGRTWGGCTGVDLLDVAGFGFVLDLLSWLSPKITRPFGGQFLIAVGQSVEAGCCAAGTPLSQMRHMPFGGFWSAGTSFAGGCCAPA